jgi:WD40 repeat protein
LLQNFLGETEKNKNVTVRLWNAVDGKLLQSFAEHANDVFAVAFSAEGKSIASGGEDNRVFVYRLRN